MAKTSPHTGPWTSISFGMPGLDVSFDWIDNDHYIYFSPRLATESDLEAAVNLAWEYGLRPDWEDEQTFSDSRIIPLIKAMRVVA